MTMEGHSMVDTMSNRMSLVYDKPGSDIQKAGYLKKLKTMKKKYFVLRSTSSSGPARLEYYDTEKKFRNNQLAKKFIHLHKCFNINRKSDTRAKNAIALYTNDDCFTIVAENSEEQEDWLRLLLEYQDEYVEDDGQTHRQKYDYVWQVTINRKHNKYLGGKNITVCGQYRVCLSASQVCLVRNNSDIPDFIFQLSSIRRCGHTDNFFLMEVGRQAPTGEGELLMQVDDSVVAQNMHEVILNSMKSSSSSSHSSSTFRQRSSTSTSMINRREALLEHNQQASLRPRTGSESRCQIGSPRKVTARPQSTAFQRSPNTSSEPSPLGHSPNPVSPHMYENANPMPLHTYENTLQATSGHRYRSDSAESHGSRSSVALSCDLYGSSPAEQFMTSHRSMTPESIQPPITEESAYLPMSPGQRSTTPSPPHPPNHLERPGSAGSDAVEITGTGKSDGYIEMKPTGSVSSSGNDSGYMDMVINQHTGREEKGSVESGNSYMMMGGHHIGRPSSTSVAIPMRQAKEAGYMDMAPSSQPLPTVKEGGSGEAYLPMTPTGLSPMSSMELRPAKVISYLSDDSMSGEFPKRAYSVGSRPVSKSLRYHQHVQEPPPVERAVTDNGRSSSAPHLIVQKIKNQSQGAYMPMDSSNLSCSPSVKSDDSDSFMELDFYRPRTSSDSFSCRPRASSFGKMYNVAQGHRPRSSSYGQSSRGGKHQAHLGSFESVRTTSKELLYKRSQESLSRFSTTSSKASSSESLRKGSRTSDYVDMTASKGQGDNSGYIDMTIGVSASKSGTSRSSSSQSLSSSPAVSGITSPSRQDKPSPDIKVIKASGHVIQKPVSFVPSNHSPQLSQDGIPSQSALFSPISFSSASGGSRSPSVKGRSPASSGKESEEESYVQYEPGTAKVEHSSSEKENLKVKEDTKSSKKKKHKDKHDKHGKHGDKSEKGKKAESGKRSPKTENVVKEQTDVYLEYEPGSLTVESTDKAVGQAYKQMHYSPKSDSRKAVQVSEPTDGKLDSSSVDVNPPSITSVLQVDDSAYMDFNPADSAEINQAVPLAEDSKSKIKPSPESEYMSYEPSAKDIDVKADVHVKEETKVPQNASDASTIPGKGESYQYMDFDPSTHQIETDVKSEVKSPKRVRSYIASGGSSLDAELGSSSSSSSLSSLANVKGVDDKNEKKTSESSRKSASSQGQEKQKDEVNETAVKIQPKSNKKKADRKDVEVKKITKICQAQEEIDDGYVGLDYGSGKIDLCEDGSEHGEVDLLKPLPVKSEIAFCSDGGSYKPGIRRLLSSDKKDGMKIDDSSERVMDCRVGRKISAPLLGQYGQKAPLSNQRMSPARKVSVSSLNEEVSDKEPCSSADLQRSVVAGAHIGADLHKQNSMPCMAVPCEAVEQQIVVGGAVDFVNNPRSRHSCSDLTGAYEQMKFPANNNLDSSHQQSSSQQQLAPPTAPQLNYASLDLGSSENVDDPKSPRIKSRHPSSADEATGLPLSYAEIDFKKSENLRNSGNNKDVSFSLD